MTASTASSDKLPPLKKFPFAGWVPTANGRLSFRHIGEARHPTTSKYANISTNDQRFVVAYQKRPLSDVLFQPIIHYLFDMSGLFWFGLSTRSIGVPGAIHAMCGNISIFKSREDWKSGAENTVRDAINQLNTVRLSLDKSRDEQISHYFKLATTTLTQTADVNIEFILYRTGEVFFARPTFSDKDLEYASLSFAKEGGHDFARWISDQAFFFLRDLTHQHQHHSPSVDTILILQESNSADTAWRNNIVYSLYYYIIRSKRFKDAISLFQAAGILGYCKSFKEICVRRRSSMAIEFKEYNDEALMQSLMAKANENTLLSTELSFWHQVRLSKAANRRTFVLALVAIVLGLLGILRAAKNHPG